MPFKIVRDDLTRMQVDAIVNTANPRPLIGSGTDAAVYAAAGAENLLKARRKIGDIARGDAAVTKAFALPARYVIHTVGPVWQGGLEGEEEILRSCYEKSLELAAKKRCKSIAFPLISTGNYGFPKDLALKIVVDAVWHFLKENDMMIYLVVFGSGATRLSEKLFASIESRIDDEYVREMEEVEYRMPHLDSVPIDDYRERRRGFANRDAETSILLESFPAADFSVEKEEEFPVGKSPAAGRPQIGAKQEAPRKKKPTVRSLSKLLDQQEETFSQMLLRLIGEKGMTNVEAYKKANQDKKVFSKIKNDIYYQPKKKTAMAFALALELNLDEAKDLLLRAGYGFSPSNDFDRVIGYCIEAGEYNIFNIEIILYDLGLDCLCNH